MLNICWHMFDVTYTLFYTICGLMFYVQVLWYISNFCGVYCLRNAFPQSIYVPGSLDIHWEYKYRFISEFSILFHWSEYHLIQYHIIPFTIKVRSIFISPFLLFYFGLLLLCWVFSRNIKYYGCFYFLWINTFMFRRGLYLIFLLILMRIY